MDIELYKIGISVLVGILTSGIGVISYFVKDTRTKIDKNIAENEERIEKVKEDFASFKALLPHQYAMRDDMIRSQAAIDNKVEIINRNILEIKESIGKLVGGEGNAN